MATHEKTSLTVDVTVRCKDCEAVYQVSRFLRYDFDATAIQASWIHQCPGKDNPEEINFDGRLARWAI